MEKEREAVGSMPTLSKHEEISTKTVLFWVGNKTDKISNLAEELMLVVGD